jgi:hypothetical protein
MVNKNGTCHKILTSAVINFEALLLLTQIGF